jgi:hypothetical protein
VAPPHDDGTGLGVVVQPAFSPDSLVAVTGYGTGSVGLKILDPLVADTTVARVTTYPEYLFPQDGAAANAPRWSPDGTRMGMIARPPGTTARQQLWAVRRNMSLPPKINSISGHTIVDSLPYWDINAIVDVPLTLIPSVSDPEGDPITKSVFFLRPDLGMSASSGTFSWTPPGSAIDSTYAIKFIATTPSGGTAYAIVRITVFPDDGGCPFVDAQVGPGWVAENTILGRSLLGVPVVDAYRLHSAPTLTEGRYALRIRENEHEVTSLDRTSLVAIDHAPGLQPLWVNGAFMLGTLQPVSRVTHTRAQGKNGRLATRAITKARGDVTALVTGSHSPGFVGAPGDTLLIDRRASAHVSGAALSTVASLGARADSTIIVINSLGKDGNAADSSIVLDGLSPTDRDRSLLTRTGLLV